MSLHDQINSLRCIINDDEVGPDFMKEAYRDGFLCAKKKAARLSANADDLIDRALVALECCANPESDGLDAAMAEDTANMIRSWKWKNRSRN